MNKKELLSQLENAKNNYVLTLAAVSLFCNKQSFPILEKSKCNFGSFEVPFNQVVKIMSNKDDKKITLEEFIKMGVRVLVKESFELIKNYTEGTAQFDKFKGWENYLFFKTIRNSVSHNFKIEIKSKKERDLLPFKWRNKKITKEMNNSYLALSFFGYHEAYLFFNDLIKFSEKI